MEKKIYKYKPFDDYVKKHKAEKERLIFLETKFGNFNPDTDVIVPKQILDFSNQFKVISGIAAKVDEVHAVHTGKYFQDIQKEKPLAKRQRDNLRIEGLRRNAHIKAINRAK